MQTFDPDHVRGAAHLILSALVVCLILLALLHLPDGGKPPRNKRLEEYLKNKHKPEE